MSKKNYLEVEGSLQRSCPSDYIRHIHHAFIIIFETSHTGLIIASLNVLVKLLPSSPFSLSPCFYIGVRRVLSASVFLFPSASISWAMLALSIQFSNLDFTLVATCSTAGSTFGLVTYIFKVSILCTFPYLCTVFSKPYSSLWLYLICFQLFPFLLFFCSRSRDFSLTRESNSLSDYRHVRLLSLEPRLFLYCPRSTTLSFRL